MSTVNVHLSDPATCASPNGAYLHVYVSVSDVQANMSATAGAGDSGWVDLTPNLSSAPMQIDLLGQANNQCFLATLGDTLQLQAGSYQQLRLILASDSTVIANNACNASANCVVLAVDASVHALELSSEDKTGIKIPSGQIASGAFTIAAGQTKDLDIDFNTCCSILQEGNGTYRLKPVLHAGAVSTTSSSINGTVVDASTGNPVAGNVFVSVEQPDANGIDRVVMSTQAGTDGTFLLCPLSAGTYDVVIVGRRAVDGALYLPTIVTGVAPGSTTGSVQLNSPPTALAAVSSSELEGLVTTAGATSAISEDITMSVLETVNSKEYTIPQQPSTSPFFAATQVVTTVALSGALTCPAGTDCIGYTLPATSGGAYYGAWTMNGVTLAPVSATTTLAAYAADGTSTSCTTMDATSAVVALTGSGPFSSVSMAELDFKGCQ